MEEDPSSARNPRGERDEEERRLNWRGHLEHLRYFMQEGHFYGKGLVSAKMPEVPCWRASIVRAKVVNFALS